MTLGSGNGNPLEGPKSQCSFVLRLEEEALSSGLERKYCSGALSTATTRELLAVSRRRDAATQETRLRPALSLNRFQYSSALPRL